MRAVLPHLVRYLVAEGLLDPAAAVDGGLTVSTGRNRNRFAIVKPRAGPGFFVKQADGELLSAATVAREAAFYALVADAPWAGALRAAMPAFHRYDPEKHMLVTGLVSEADNLTILHEKLGVFPTPIASRTGEVLATLHSTLPEIGGPPPMAFSGAPHWILHLHGGTNLDNMRSSPASARIVDLLLAAPGLADHLSTLRSAWAGGGLIHSDMRWENCLLAPRAAPIERRHLSLVDWELVDTGDAAWDVGGALQCYLNSWIVSMPAVSEASPDRLVAAAKRPLETVQPAMEAFWLSYLAAGGAAGEASSAFLERAVRMMAARMLVTAFEISARSNAIDARVMLILQTALNVFERPAAASRDLLGIGRGTSARSGERPE